MRWLSIAPGFHFVLDEGDVHAVGDLKRQTPGRELVQFKANGEEWRAAAGIKGVTWERRDGTSWKAADAPAYGNRVYQRVTLAFDPQKKEGVAQPVEPGYYRFTNANTSEVHEVWVTDDNRIRRMKIGNTVELRIEN